MRQDPKTLGRRQFFRALGGSTVALGAAEQFADGLALRLAEQIPDGDVRAADGVDGAAAAAVASPMGATEAQAYDPGNDETRARYRESDHVKAFYRTNGYETLKKNTDPASTGPK